MSRVAGWYLPKMITNHASSLSLYILEEVFEKARETFEM